MQEFAQEFKTLEFVIDNAESVLLFAHTRPDPDAVGANTALAEHIRSRGKRADIGCFDPAPTFAKDLFPVRFTKPDDIDFTSYQAIIAADSVDRGFHLVRERIPGSAVVVLIDHHPDIDADADLRIIDVEHSSSSEIVYRFLKSQDKPVTPSMATALLLGILGDTGGLQHANTKPPTMRAVSDLIRYGARLPKLSDHVFCNKRLELLRLWGRALAKARVNEKAGMVYSALTKEDLDNLGNPDVPELKDAATLLDQSPNTRFALFFFQLDENTVRASLRTEPSKGVDVSAIARLFGGGGHKLASGFEIKGRIVETPDGWAIV